jgi:diguanylate cyclase (GGDEF)-like protein/PAS domain S-box-containing protein
MQDLPENTSKNLWPANFLSSSTFVEFINLMPEAAIFSNEDGKIILTNVIAQTLFQYSEKEFKTITIEDIVPQTIRDIHIKFRKFFFGNPAPRFLEGRGLDLSACKKDGTSFPMESALFAIKTEEGTIAVNLLRDVSSQKEDQAKISEYAFVDALTNLPNRRYFDANLKRNAAKTRRHDQTLALLFIDLDHFKPINDNDGHEIGDNVLRTIADRLANTIRDEDFLARIGGDEFIIMLYPVKDIMAVNKTCERLLTACRAPIHINNKTFVISASIGAGTNSSNVFQENQLLSEADKAMYIAKEKGGDQYYLCPEIK